MSVERSQVFKCSVCGLEVESLNAAAGYPVCCGKPMVLEVPDTVDASREKHVPTVTGDAMGILVKVGALPHPMTEEHHIEWIEVLNRGYVNRYYLRPGDAAEAMFYVPLQGGLVVRAFCNLHGLWEMKTRDAEEK